MVTLVRSASLNGLAEILRAAGAKPERIAEACGVPARALTEPDLKLESQAVGRLLERAAEITGLEDLGLRLASARRLSNLGAVGLIAREQPSLRRALDVLGQYIWLHNEAVALALEIGDEVAFCRIVITGPGARQATDLLVGALGSMLRDLLGEGWRPLAVLLRHGPPRDIAPYLALFRVRPEFLASADGIVFPADLLDSPLLGADPAMAAQIERLIAASADRQQRSFRNRAEELITLLLPTGACTADQVARHLGFDRRTLHRKLTHEGTNFRSLLDEARKELVLSALQGPRSLTEIADLAGFSASSAFTHWFTRRFGVAPGQRRKFGAPVSGGGDIAVSRHS